MATTYYPDFTKLSQFDDKSNVIAVRYGADAPVTEMELNELQLIQNFERKKLSKFVLKNGLDVRSGSIGYASGKVSISNMYAFVDGYVIFIDSAEVSVSSGTVYLNVWEKQTVGPNDIMKEYGNDGGTQMTNYIMDSRYGQEISKRILVAYSLSTSQVSGGHSIQIASVSSGSVKWLYDRVAPNFPVVDTKDYLYDSAKEIQFTWDELNTKSANGDFSGLEIGDYKSITLIGDLAGTVIRMDLAGLDTYYGHSSNGNHTMDFVCHDIPFKHRVHSSNNTVGGYENMELYSYFETTVYNCLPAEVKSVIKAKKCLLENKGAADSTSWAWKYLKLWLLGEAEVFGYHSWGQLDYGFGNEKRYPLFRSEKYIIKKYSGTAHWWWLLNPRKGSTTNWCIANHNGYSYGGTDASNTDGGVVFGFRI